jgi:hypothetical protein
MTSWEVSRRQGKPHILVSVCFDNLIRMVCEQLKFSFNLYLSRLNYFYGVNG